MVKLFLRRCVPEQMIQMYHYALARLASMFYWFPSKKLIVIGVTGTNGKSSTTQFIGRILEFGGEKVGWTTTVGFKIANREWTNDQKMTMLGRFQTQKLLRQMVQDGCRYAIIETSSQGIVQHRNVGIHYTMGVFTNLTPEHLEAHGGFENYKNAKKRLFVQVARNHGIAVVNLMDAYAKEFLAFAFKTKWGFTSLQEESSEVDHVMKADRVEYGLQGTTFEIESVAFRFQPIGRFNFENVLAAITTCRALGLSLEKIRDAVATLASAPGRLERIDEGQPFTVIVDYAPEPVALAATYEALALIPHKRLIHILGSTGGGRDVSRRTILGEMAAKQAQIVIVTNEDPYEDDPMEIIQDVASGSRRAGKQDEVNLFCRLDRQAAIELAVKMAETGDLILITGKGNEPVMAVAHGKKIPWDDRTVVREALRQRGVRERD